MILKNNRNSRITGKRRILPFTITALFFIPVSLHSQVVAQNKTNVIVSVPSNPVQINSLIYGQMLENVNDSVIYRGVVNEDGSVRQNLIPHLKALNIPVMRWPGGTVIHEYHWKNGIGDKRYRPVVTTTAWKGIENYQFGTDEFLQWCKEVNTAPYINFNMANNAINGGTLGEALDWIEYINGHPDSTVFGKLRTGYGNREPYHVKFWGIGNENYGPWGTHTTETAYGYGERLKLWASTINNRFKGLHLLGVGHTAEWNKVVLEKAGSEIDYLTQHYYVTSRFKNNSVEHPYNSLFAPLKMEKHLQLLGDYLNYFNLKNRVGKLPIRLSIDEWNNRHAVFNGNDYKLNRQDPRRQIDVAIAAGMLNVFIRNSETVGMANYIFPVNGHGLIRTNGAEDSFKTPLYYLFEKYRQSMIGERLNVAVKGRAINASLIQPSIEGDCSEVVWGNEELTFIDAVSCRTSEGKLNVALINRSNDQKEKVSVKVPDGYIYKAIWELESEDINNFNSIENRNRIIPEIKNNTGKKVALTDILMEPCSVVIIEFDTIR